jgi:hypothetical protein
MGRSHQRPYYRTMIKNAINNLQAGIVEHSDIENYVTNNYGNINRGTLADQINICTVNIPSRVNYPQNQRPRVCNDSRYDFLYSVGFGQVEKYDPQLHGIWEIRKDKNDNLVVVISGAATKKR